MSLEVKIKKKLKEFTLESELNVETGWTFWKWKKHYFKMYRRRGNCR